MLFKLVFSKNTFLPCLFCSLNFYISILISEFIAQIFNPIAELVMATEIPSKEAKAETEIHPVIV